MQIIFSCSVYSLIVYICCIMQHVNNILIVCFQQNHENLCTSHERPSFGFSCGYSIYMAEAVLEYFVRRVVTNSLEISFQRALPTVLTTNKGNAMTMWRTVTIIYMFLLSALHIFLSLAINSYYWATITSNLVTRDFDWHLLPKMHCVIDDPVWSFRWVFYFDFGMVKNRVCAMSHRYRHNVFWTGQL
jgi:hypothetical protein